MRMSRETQKKLGLTDRQVDFDEFLQEDEESPRYEVLKRKLDAVPALRGLTQAVRKG